MLCPSCLRPWDRSSSDPVEQRNSLIKWSVKKTLDNACVGIHSLYMIHNLFNNCGSFNVRFLLSSKTTNVYMNIYPEITPCIDRYKGNPINKSYIRSIPQYNLVHLTDVKCNVKSFFLLCWRHGFNCRYAVKFVE